MAETVEFKTDVAVAAMHSAADRSALAALVDLAAEPPEAVVDCLAGRILDLDVSGLNEPRPTDHLPNCELIAAVSAQTHWADFRMLLELGGGTYDGLLALLVAVLAANQLDNGA